MTDEQLRRRYRVVMALLVVPPAQETVEDDLELHRCALEMEAARRGLSLDPTPVRDSGLRWSGLDLLVGLLLALFALGLIFCMWPS